MQRLQEKARISKGSYVNGLRALKSKFTYFSWKYVLGMTESEYKRAFSHIIVLKTPFEKNFTSVLIKSSNLDGMYPRKNFQAYNVMEPHLFKDTMIEDFDFIEKYMIETILHEREIHQLLNAKKLQTQEVQINTVKALDVDLVIIEYTCFGKENSSSETAFDKLVKESSLDCVNIV
ncbi:hypothetical protein Tco_0422808 [Tanacetum coccineum]